MIAKTISQTSESWLGRIVWPRRLLTSNRVRVTTWLVDAAAEAPATVITLNGFIINIEKYPEISTNKKAATWVNISPKLDHEIVPGRIDEEGDTVTDKGGVDRETSFANVVNQGRPKEGGAKDVVMVQSDLAEDWGTKRKLGAEEETPKAESEAVAKQA